MKPGRVQHAATAGGGEISRRPAGVRRDEACFFAAMLFHQSKRFF
jgi:hypothetical protein